MFCFQPCRSAGRYLCDSFANRPYFDGDCDVDLADFSIFAEHWLQTGCNEPDWCGGADLTKEKPDGLVDTFDLLKFAQLWLEGR